jgi:hypothetical protein
LFLKRGLVKELENFYQQIPNREKIDWTKGLFQAIGKEQKKKCKRRENKKRTKHVEKTENKNC